MTTITLKDAQARLLEAVKRTNAGPVLLEDDGRPLAIVLSVEEYRRLFNSGSQQAYEQVFGPFDRGEFRELSAQDWEDLADGKRTSPHDPDSWALPPKAREA